MLPKAREVKLDFEALGRQMLARKRAAELKGIPADAEHAMVAGKAAKADSPAVAARRRKRPAPRKASRKDVRKRSARRRS